MSYVAEGKSVLGICEKVDRKPNPVHGMPPDDANAAKKFLLKYVKTREEFIMVLTELIELTKISSLPGDLCQRRSEFENSIQLIPLR